MSYNHNPHQSKHKVLHSIVEEASLPPSLGGTTPSRLSLTSGTTSASLNVYKTYTPDHNPTRCDRRDANFRIPYYKVHHDHDLERAPKTDDPQPLEDEDSPYSNNYDCLHPPVVQLASLAHLRYYKQRLQDMHARPHTKSNKRGAIFRITYYKVHYDPNLKRASKQRVRNQSKAYSNTYLDKRGQWVEATMKVMLPEPTA